MNDLKILDESETVKFLMEALRTNYFEPIYNQIRERPSLKSTIPGLIINPHSIVIYMGKTHIAIEFSGSEVLRNDMPYSHETEVRFFDFSLNDGGLLENIISFNNTCNTGISPPIFGNVFDLVWATNDGYEKLEELRWNYSAQDMMLIMNASMPIIIENKSCSLINSFFFDADEKGLKTRHIKWMNFIPIIYDDTDSRHDTFKINEGLIREIAIENAYTVYPLPEEYKNIHLPKINRFIELWGNEDTTEPQITKFLEENSFILKMAFGATNIYAEKDCIWQSEERKAIRPDFFIESPNRVDIVEFKLPTIKNNSVVGRENRESFCSQLNSYVAQTRTYANYFNDPNNRIWVQEEYGIDVYKPRRILIIGRRTDFNRKEWKEIVADYDNFDVITFDDLVDKVVAQFYHE